MTGGAGENDDALLGPGTNKGEHHSDCRIWGPFVCLSLLSCNINRWLNARVWQAAEGVTGAEGGRQRMKANCKLHVLASTSCPFSKMSSWVAFVSRVSTWIRNLIIFSRAMAQTVLAKQTGAGRRLHSKKVFTLSVGGGQSRKLMTLRKLFI